MVKRVLFVGCIFIILVGAEVFRELYAPISEKHAREAAGMRFAQVCRNSHLEPGDYDGPVRTSVGGADFAFEWRPKRKGQRTVLISVARGGIVEPTFLDDTR